MRVDNPPTEQLGGKADGFLPAALTRFGDAVSALVDQKPHWLDGQGRTIWAASWYEQLAEAVAGTQGIGHSIPRSRPSCNLEALDLRIEIDDTVSDWQPDGTSTEHRLAVMSERRWRPQDTTDLDAMTDDLKRWVERIKTLLTEERVKTFKDAPPCPACQTQYVYRRDYAGEMVRQPSLQITTAGCQCSRCRTVWAPSQFTFLARVLGYDPPAGVLE